MQSVSCRMKAGERMREGRWMGMDRKRSTTVLQADLKAVRGEYNMTSDKSGRSKFRGSSEAFKSFSGESEFSVPCKTCSGEISLQNFIGDDS